MDQQSTGTSSAQAKDVYGVFEGGGVKGIALVAAVAAFEEEKIGFHAVAGTSAGAIVAALIAAGFSAPEMKDILIEKNFEDFKDPISTKPLWRWYKAYKKMGFYHGDAFRNWINGLLEKKLNKVQPRMEDLPKPLTVYATNLFNRRIDWFKGPKGVVGERYLQEPIASAVRASMSIPGFFVPHECASNTFVDGGVLSNFPGFAFEEDVKFHPLPVVGFRLDSGDHSGPVENSNQLISAIIDTVVSHNSNNNLPETNIINLPTLGISTTDFDITKEQKGHLYGWAKTSTENWLLTNTIT